MIFSHTLDLVLSGVKTQTRRLKKPHEHLYPTEPGTVYGETRAGLRRVYQVGTTYAVQPGRAKKAVAFIVLRSIRDQRVISTSEADAIAEGFDSRESFFAAWRAIHGAKADLQAWVWVLEFELLSVYSKTVEEDPPIGGQKDRMSRASSFSIPTPRPSSMDHSDAVHGASYGEKESTTEDTEN